MYTQTIKLLMILVAVPCRIRTLFRPVFRARLFAYTPVSQEFQLGRDSYSLCKLINVFGFFTPSISPALKVCSEIL